MPLYLFDIQAVIMFIEEHYILNTHQGLYKFDPQKKKARRSEPFSVYSN